MSEPLLLEKTRTKRGRWLTFHLSTAILLMFLAGGAVGAGIWYYKRHRFRETINSLPIEKLANRIMEDASLQGASAIYLAPNRSIVQVTYRIGSVDSIQMDLPASCYTALRARFVELCDGGDEIDYTLCNPDFPLKRLRLEFAKTPDSQDFKIKLLEPTPDSKPVQRSKSN